MSINTQKLLDEIERRYAALDSTSSLSEIQRVSELNTRKDGPILTGGLQYSSLNQANAPSGIGDSANVGEIFFVADRQLDSNGRFYFRSQNAFVNMKTALDSDENVLIDSDAAAAAAGGAAAYVNFGSNYGYTTGGVFPLSAQPASAKNEINRFAFTSDGNAVDVGDLTVQRFRHNVGQNATVGVVAAGQTGPSGPSQTDDIDTWPFASATVNAADTGHNHPAPSYKGITQSHPISDGTSTWFDWLGSLYRYNFSSNTSTAGVFASHSGGIDYSGGPSASDTNGYLAGWMANGNVAQNNIVRFPFAAADGAWTIVDVGDLNAAKAGGAGANSSTHAFSAGSDYSSPHYTDTIYKWAFASDGNSSDIGNLSSSRGKISGQSSTTHGYASGGTPGYVNVIEKYPFSSTGNATDVGDLTNGKYSPGGHSN